VPCSHETEGCNPNVYVYIYMCIMWFKLYVIFTSHNWEWLIPEIYGDWGD
jgi:hypothetical protein